MYTPFSDSLNQLQNISTATNPSDRSNDHTFILKTNTTTVAALSRYSLVSLNIVDAYSLSKF